jgi:hypothetical protein
MAHNFEVETVLRPTFCDYCQKFIWGFSNQMARCKVCGLAIHKKCIALVSSTCQAKDREKVKGSLQFTTKVAHSFELDTEFLRGVTYCGWLHKEGQGFGSTRARFFILKNSMLFYFKVSHLRVLHACFAEMHAG